MRLLLQFALISVSILAFGCGEDPERPEKVEKLRTLGVVASPHIIVPASLENPSITKLEVSVMVPLEQSVEVEEFVETQGRSAFVIENLRIDQSSLSYSSYGAFRIAKFEARFSNPTTPVFEQYGGVLMRVRYGVRVTSGDEEEKIVGDVLMLAPGSPELAWSVPTIQIESPASTVPTGRDEIELHASVTNPNDESIKVGWYVSSGEVENRRASKTTWKNAQQGTQTVVATVRGKKSRTFSYSIRDVVID